MPTIAWADLTVPDAEPLRDFYARVTGMTTSAVDMGGYSDFCLHEAGGDPIVCHARGGAIVSGPHKMGQDRYCVIKDRAGAYSALYEKK